MKNQSIELFIKKLMNDTKDPGKPAWNMEVLRAGKENRWNYIDGCMLTSLIALYEETKNKEYLDFVISYVDHYVNEDGVILGYDPTHYSTDDLSESRILFDLYKYTKNEKYLKAIELSYSQIANHPRTNAGNFWHKKIYHDQVWLDGLYMIQPFYTRYNTQFNKKEDYKDTLNQFKNVRALMFDEDKKLYYHAYDESKSLFWANKKTGLSKHFWLRAIGWYAASLADVAYYMEDSEGKKYLASLLKETIDGLLQYQDPKTKMFYQIVDLGTREKNYLESSGSALIAYAILKATNNNLLDASYKQIGLDIFNGICTNFLTDTNGDLNLENICLVAGVGPESNPRRDGSYEYYMSEPIVKNDAKGVGPLIMAYSEVIKA
ncbi:Glycosyl hydrolase, family 88 [Alteracholeplasma palmae J233]|uniref:Glycosyl hydrolase, family 88 n=1 Tax=Alteracholeplasma palmae (strain ATCC 49389 / J233) TaxID=1318466 RepID=U4KRQ2_ALTPJ|nr:glycoside hydrolase family 88 protein [Alteracholeplasma palmae]CCV64366.1 Glycosyl hydrolase, family 88 [Alteracholeplasma palmae J233]